MNSSPGATAGRESPMTPSMPTGTSSPWKWTIDGSVVHSCAGLVCLGDGKAPAASLHEMHLIAAINEIKKHVFMPLVGTAIWGNDTINGAHVVLANALPVLRVALPPNQPLTEAVAMDLLAEIEGRLALEVEQ